MPITNVNIGTLFKAIVTTFGKTNVNIFSHVSSALSSIDKYNSTSGKGLDFQIKSLCSRFSVVSIMTFMSSVSNVNLNIKEG